LIRKSVDTQNLKNFLEIFEKSDFPDSESERLHERKAVNFGGTVKRSRCNSVRFFLDPRHLFD
jgi:hypothetical protein